MHRRTLLQQTAATAAGVMTVSREATAACGPTNKWRQFDICREFNQIARRRFSGP